MPASEKDLGEFLKWATENGAYVHPSLRFDAASGRVFATQPIEPGTKLLTCPHELAIRYEEAAAKLESLHKNVRQMSPEAVMCWFVMGEIFLNPESFWMPYFKILPKDFDTPLYFDEEDMMFLQGCNMGPADIEARKVAWHEEYNAGRELLDLWGDCGITWENYLWVRTVFSSRSFPDSLMDSRAGNIRDNTGSPVLFPVIDSLNHKPKTKVTWATEEDAFGLVIDEPVAAGQEVFNNYGPKPNEELLMGYGFCLDPNPTDTVVLRINITRDMLSKPQRHIRRRQLQPAVPGIFTIRAFGASCFDPSLMGLFRVLAASESDLSWFSDNPEAEWVSVRNEVKALDMLLKGGLIQKLQRFKELGLQPRNSKQEAAMIYRKGQMALLRKAKDEAEGKIKTYINETKTATLEDALADPVWAEAVQAVWGTPSVEALVEAEMEDVVFMFYIAWRYLTTTDETWRTWFKVMEEAYGDPKMEPKQVNEDAEALMEEMFDGAAEAAPGVFGIEGFTTGLIGWAMKISEMEQVMTTVDGEKWGGYFLTPPGVKP